MQLALLGDGVGGRPVQAVLGQIIEHLEGVQQLLLVVAHVVVVAGKQKVDPAVPLEEIDDLDNAVIHQGRTFLPQNELPSTNKRFHQVNCLFVLGSIKNLSHVRGVFQQFRHD